jgi:hypothetical protein
MSIRGPGLPALGLLVWHLGRDSATASLLLKFPEKTNPAPPPAGQRRLQPPLHLSRHGAAKVQAWLEAWLRQICRLRIEPTHYPSLPPEPARWLPFLGLESRKDGFWVLQ